MDLLNVFVTPTELTHVKFPTVAANAWLQSRYAAVYDAILLATRLSDGRPFMELFHAEMQNLIRTALTRSQQTRIPFENTQIVVPPIVSAEILRAYGITEHEYCARALRKWMSSEIGPHPLLISHFIDGAIISFAVADKNPKKFARIRANFGKALPKLLNDELARILGTFLIDSVH